jgi:outer membrane immunogenic protein
VIGGNWLVYGTGGLAVAKVGFTDFVGFAASNTFNAASVSNTKTGWTAGGGLEWMIAPHWSVKGESLHVDLGTTNSTSANSNPLGFPLSTIAHSHSLTEEIGRAGVNFHF